MNIWVKDKRAQGKDRRLTSHHLSSCMCSTNLYRMRGMKLKRVNWDCVTLTKIYCDCCVRGINLMAKDFRCGSKCVLDETTKVQEVMAIILVLQLP